MLYKAYAYADIESLGFEIVHKIYQLPSKLYSPESWTRVMYRMRQDDTSKSSLFLKHWMLLTKVDKGILSAEWITAVSI